MELSEETGYRADHWLQLFDASLAPGTMDGRTQCFVAWGLHSGLAHPEPEERLLQRRVPFGQAISMALSGEISNFSSVTLLCIHDWHAANCLRPSQFGGSAGMITDASYANASSPRPGILAPSFSGRGSWHGAIKEKTHKVLEAGTDGSRRQRRTLTFACQTDTIDASKLPVEQASPRPTSGRGAPVLGLPNKRGDENASAP
jgi:hypothetical protein